MSPPLTARLDAETSRRIARIARRKGISPSEVIRRAIAAWEDVQEPAMSPYEAIRDFIGVVHSGNPKRSQQTGRRLTALLKRHASQR